jgi:hemolysin III
MKNDPAAVSATARPLFRGVSHQIFFFVSLIAGAVLLALAPTPPAMLGAAIYAASLSALLGTSALYHRVTWSPPTRRWIGRLDHSMINVLIAGTFTPFALVVLSGKLAEILLPVMWMGALAGIALHLVWFDAPKWLSAAVYVALGWVGIVAAPQVIEHAGWTVALLVLLGGLLYSAGAVVYATRRPDPLPTSFGYHEVFHALVVVAAMAHYGAVALAILPATPA